MGQRQKRNIEKLKKYQILFLALFNYICMSVH